MTYAHPDAVVPEPVLDVRLNRQVHQHVESRDGRVEVDADAFGGYHSVYEFRVLLTRTTGPQGRIDLKVDPRGILYKDTRSPNARHWRFAANGSDTPEPGGWPTLRTALLVLTRRVVEDLEEHLASYE